MTGPCREVWLVRHGQTEANAARVIQGQTDTALSAFGREQAERLAAWWSGREVVFSKVVASPLSRALVTATIVADALGLEVERDPRFMERSFGSCEGRPADEVYAEQDASGDDPYAFRPPGGESTHQMAARVRGAFDAWVERTDIGPRLLIVTHGGPVGALVARALELRYHPEVQRRYRRDNTGITILRRRSAGGWAVDTLNARPHLAVG